MSKVIFESVSEISLFFFSLKLGWQDPRNRDYRANPNQMMNPRDPRILMNRASAPGTISASTSTDSRPGSRPATPHLPPSSRDSLFGTPTLLQNSQSLPQANYSHYPNANQGLPASTSAPQHGYHPPTSGHSGQQGAHMQANYQQYQQGNSNPGWGR